MSGKSAKSFPWNTVILAWLLVGTLDITAATTNYWLGGGNEPINILIYVASGFFGQHAFEVGAPMAWWGLAFHYFIAFSWTTFFFMIYPRITFMSRANWVLVGVLFGMFIWAVMSRIVVPLSNTPKGPFNVKGAIIGCAILIVMIGLPLSYIARRRANRVTNA